MGSTLQNIPVNEKILLEFTDTEWAGIKRRRDELGAYISHVAEARGVAVPNGMPFQLDDDKHTLYVLEIIAPERKQAGPPPANIPGLQELFNPVTRSEE